MSKNKNNELSKKEMAAFKIYSQMCECRNNKYKIENGTVTNQLNNRGQTSE